VASRAAPIVGHTIAAGTAGLMMKDIWDLAVTSKEFAMAIGLDVDVMDMDQMAFDAMLAEQDSANMFADPNDPQYFFAPGSTSQQPNIPLDTTGAGTLFHTPHTQFGTQAVVDSPDVVE